MNMMFHGKPLNRTWFDWRPLGAWVLGETWYTPQASLVRQFSIGRFGVWVRLPEYKAANSWRWVIWRFGAKRAVHALRWTLPKVSV